MTGLSSADSYITFMSCADYMQKLAMLGCLDIPSCLDKGLQAILQMLSMPQQVIYTGDVAIEWEGTYPGRQEQCNCH